MAYLKSIYNLTNFYKRYIPITSPHFVRQTDNQKPHPPGVTTCLASHSIDGLFLSLNFIVGGSVPACWGLWVWPRCGSHLVTRQQSGRWAVAPVKNTAGSSFLTLLAGPVAGMEKAAINLQYVFR